MSWGKICLKTFNVENGYFELHENDCKFKMHELIYFVEEA
jgi:hypothetical protein